MNSQPPKSKRAAIIEAACQVVLAEGGEGLTLEAAARLAGVSKGGLLYHFPSKEALIIGMIEQLCLTFEEALERELVADAGPLAGRWLRAYVRASLSGVSAEHSAVSAALLAAVSSNPALLAPLRERFDRWQAQAAGDGIDPAMASVVRFAVDGVWLAELFGFAPPDPALRPQLIATLIGLANGF
jgi:AcrR family transcriptional regulator